MNILIRFGLSVFIFFSIVMPTSVFAVEPGITPDSFWYRFDLFFERVRVVFIFNNDQKAQKELEYAEERLAEAEEMVKEKKVVAVEKAISEYTKLIKSAKNIKKSRVKEVASKHQEVLERVLDQTPEKGKKGVERAIEASFKVIGKIEKQEPPEQEEAPVITEESELERAEKDIEEQEPETKEKPAEPEVIRKTPTPQPKLTPAPPQKQPQSSCARDVWECTEWTECLKEGKQNRTCDLTYDCPVAITPKPAITRSCTPSPPPTPKPEAAGIWSPLNNATNMALDVDINWTAGKNAITHDVYFGTNNPPQLRATQLTKTTYDPGALTEGTTYYWRIVEWDESEIAVGPIWKFTTKSSQPTCAQDTWGCGSWSACSNQGIQTRACNLTFDCSAAATPSPATSQSCTPPPVPPESPAIEIKFPEANTKIPFGTYLTIQYCGIGDFPAGTPTPYSLNKNTGVERALFSGGIVDCPNERVSQTNLSASDYPAGAYEAFVKFKDNNGVTIIESPRVPFTILDEYVSPPLTGPDAPKIDSFTVSDGTNEYIGSEKLTWISSKTDQVVIIYYDCVAGLTARLAFSSYDFPCGKLTSFSNPSGTKYFNFTNTNATIVNVKFYAIPFTGGGLTERGQELKLIIPIEPSS